VYFGRPEDVVPGLSYLPLAKIAGGIAVVAAIVSLMRRRAKRKLALENKLLLGLLFWYTVGIPFAFWRGGAFTTVTSKLSKGVVAAILVSLVVQELWQLKRLIWVQAAAVAAVTVASVALHHTEGGRLVGASHGILENPNDLAINLALNWPLCIAFFFLARGSKKLLWAGAIIVMLVAVQLTYSRGGFLSIALAAVLAVWEFAIRGRRLSVLVAAGILGVIVLIASPGHYAARIASIFTGQQEDSLDRGSREARKQLFIDSVETALRHPVFGIGAGNFEVTNGSWRVAHNAYTEIAAEAGLPAFVLFVLVLYCAFYNLRKVRKSDAYKRDPDIRGLTGGLWVSAGAYVMSAFFASTEYSMYPYFLVAYTTALYQISRAPSESDRPQADLNSPWRGERTLPKKPELALTRG
jgi:O-antigen ligase